MIESLEDLEKSYFLGDTLEVLVEILKTTKGIKDL
jgi:hypothetical protein